MSKKWKSEGLTVR